GGVGLIGASFALGSKANATYDAYLRETDPAEIDALYDRTVWLDRSSSGSLLLGEVLVCLGLYGRFLSHPLNAMAWRLEPGRRAAHCRGARRLLLPQLGRRRSGERLGLDLGQQRRESRPVESLDRRLGHAHQLRWTEHAGAGSQHPRRLDVRREQPHGLRVQP